MIVSTSQLITQDKGRWLMEWEIKYSCMESRQEWMEAGSSEYTCLLFWQLIKN